jgi:pyruvate carboxylase subunit B
VTIRGRVFEVEIQGDEAKVDGTSVPATLQAVPGSPVRLLALAQGVAALALVRQDGGWMVHHAGEVWDAQVVDERTRRLREMTGGTARGGAHVVVRAPMPGRVIRVEVEPGALVRQGQGVVVLEAMKMENELTAPIAGRVTAVQAETGQAVVKGAVLVEVSAEP